MKIFLENKRWVKDFKPETEQIEVKLGAEGFVYITDEYYIRLNDLILAVDVLKKIEKPVIISQNKE